MVNNISRTLIEIIVKRTLKDLKDSPERSIRNLVDMALHFSNGRFQHDFFEIAQTMLENEQSSYYDLIKDIAASVDPEQILHFGMNLGYNSCTTGAKEIRENEFSLGFNIPWTILLELDEERIINKPESYHSIISQGEELGIYTWMLFGRGQICDILPLLQNHSKDAFILFCNPNDITEDFMDCMADVNNLMIAVRCGKKAEEIDYDRDEIDANDTFEDKWMEVCSRLRERSLLYSVYFVYEDKNVNSIVNGDLFYCTEQAHPVFTALYPGKKCSEETKKEVYQAIINMRKEQKFRTIGWELLCDNNYIDSIISDGSCSAIFDKNGDLCFQNEFRSEKSLNLFQNKLADILMQAFPKQTIKENI